MCTNNNPSISEISSKLWNSPSFKSLTCMSGLLHLCFCFAPWTAHNALCFKMTAASKKFTISFSGFSLLLRSNGHVSSNNTVVCVGFLKVFFLALSFFSYTLMIFFILQSIFHLFSLQMMPIFFFVIKTKSHPCSTGTET